MKRLVDDLLAFSRVHTGRREPSPVDSGAVFDAVHRRLSGESEAGGADVTRGGLPTVRADARQLDQLLRNLITTGLKYRREGIPPRVHVTAAREGDFWRFAVSDNGIGIEAQYHGRIFVIFQRLHGRETYEGTGIGLAVCKKIVEGHGGRLWVESIPGEGCPPSSSRCRGREGAAPGQAAERHGFGERTGPVPHGPPPGVGGRGSGPEAGTVAVAPAQAREDQGGAHRCHHADRQRSITRRRDPSLRSR
ncbi:ATP-binding protein [Deinococcus sp. YIM 134068]|uniref:sensor histidine kinase n=1 Tax=Deinococcus lichenicola TaxID=3118910 RepID=UPI002F92BFE2